jgi:hypothetical protein
MPLVAARLAAAGFDVRQEDGDAGPQLDIAMIKAALVPGTQAIPHHAEPT